MTAILWATRLGLAGVFAVASIAKLRDRQSAEATVAGAGVPPRLRPAVAFGLSVVELAVAALLVLPGLAFVGASGAVALLTVFLAVLGVQYARGFAVPCACFGQLTPTPAGWPTLLRNGALAAASLFVLSQV